MLDDLGLALWPSTKMFLAWLGPFGVSGLLFVIIVLSILTHAYFAAQMIPFSEPTETAKGRGISWARKFLSNQPLIIELTDEPSFVETGWGAEEDLLNRMTRDKLAETEAVPVRVYKIAIRNTTPQTIKNVSVRLLDIEGCPDLLGRLPTCLRWTEYRFTKPFQRFVDLPPGDDRYFVDVVRTEFDVNHKTMPRAVICHMIDDIVGEIPVGARRIKIQVTGENVASDTKILSFMNRNGERKLRLENSRS